MDMLNDSEVMITLDGRERALVMSLSAAQKISRMHGGITGAQQQVMAQNMDAMVSIISAGLNLSDKDARALPGQVFRTGLVNLIVPLVRFIAGLGNGGKVPSDSDADAEPVPEGNG